MTTTSKIHPFAEWAKSRLDEMEAALAIFERKVEKGETATRNKADQAIAAMKKHRDVFKTRIKREHDSDVKAWATANSDLDAEWQGFEDAVESYWKAASDRGHDKVEAYAEAFKSQADAQQKAWAETARQITQAAQTFQKDRKTEVMAMVAKAEHIALSAGAKLDSINTAGETSWSAMRSALTESRAAFDTANSKAQAAFMAAAQKDKTT